MLKKELRELRLQLYTLRFEPKKEFERTHNTRKILKEVFQYLRKLKQQGKGHLIDRHENQDKPEPRELFITTQRPLPKESRIRFSIALLRKGKVPKLKPKDKFKLLPLSELGGDIAEETHFYIDFSGNSCIVCAEYNYNGPRANDLEFYLRNIAGPAHLKIVKATELNALYTNSLEDTLASLKNVLHMDIKVKPSSLVSMDADVRKQYYSSMENIGKDLKPKFFRIQTYFQVPGSNAPVDVNIEANNWFRGMLGVFKTRTRNTKMFEHFEVKYQDIHGEDAIFNLLKGREEIKIEVDAKKDIINKDLYTLLKPKFDTFIAQYYND